MPDENKKEPHLVDEILSDFAVYTDPKLLKEEFCGLLDTASANTNGIKKYRELLSNVRYAWQKTLRYVSYFEEFYPPDGNIEKFEALNHHIHAYLQDMTILKNKIEVLLGEMKNDIKKVASNKDEIDVFFKAGVEKTKEVFDGVSKHRDTHHHRGMRFLDGDLLKAENAHGALEMFSTPIFDAMLNQKYKPELLAKFEKEKEESFEAGKARWIEMAHENNKQVSGYLNELLDGIRPNLYQFLNIRPVKDIIGASEKRV